MTQNLNKAFGFPVGKDEIAYTGTAAKSTAALSGMKQYIITATSDCYVMIDVETPGTAVSATNAHWFVAAGVPFTFQASTAVAADQYLHVVQKDDAGTLYLTEMEQAH